MYSAYKLNKHSDNMPLVDFVSEEKPASEEEIVPYLGFPGGSDGKASVCNAGDLCSIPGWGDPLEKEMTAQSSILSGKIPWTVEPGRLLSMGSQSVYSGGRAAA